jgi:aminomethyltransferase
MPDTLADQFVRSPLRDQFPDGTTVEVVGSAEVVADYGDAEAEYRAIRGDAARIDLSGAGLVEVSGDDAYDLLQAVLSRDLEFVTPEQSLTGALLGTDGEVIDVVTTYHFGDGFRLETSLGRGALVVAHLTEQAGERGLSAEVSLNASGQTIVLVEGPRAGKVLEEVIDPDLSALPLSGLLEVSLNDLPLLVSRTGFTGEFGYKIFVAADDVTAVWEALADLPAAGRTALETAMFEVRQPIVNREVVAGLSALRLGYGWLVDITKEEFVGRDAVDKAFGSGQRSEVVGFSADGDVAPAGGSVVSVGGEAVGEVVHALVSPAKGVLGLVHLRPELVAPGIEFEIGDDSVAAKTLPAPYIVPASWTAR